MPFSHKLLNENEELVLDLHPHWVYFVKSGLVFIGVVALGIWILSLGDPADAFEIASAGAIVIVLVWVAWTYLKWVTTNFVITTDRLIYRHGVISKHGIEIPLERVNTVFFSQGIIERIVGSGDLVIESAGELGRQDFANVRKPSAVQNEIHKQMEANENRKFDRVNAPRSELTIPEQIAQLDDLRQRGAISQAEFDQKKQQLLDRM